jgi:tRNA uridine 5-carboxymethylaminomethyl modification enzyme
LNRSKGPAMWSPRTQNDRMLFSYEWRMALEKNHNIKFWQDTTLGLLIKGNKCIGVKTLMDLEIKAKVVILSNGTFLNGIIHIGEKNFPGGRIGENPSYGLTEQLRLLGFESGRMKTGTPVRVDARSLDFNQMDEQKGDINPGKFSFLEVTKPLKEQRSCFITYTNPEVHDILRKGFSKSPMFNNRIKGIGPRYCPSIEDKIERFSHRDRHQLFIEPEGWNTVEMYVNGFSSSLPEEIQLEALRKIKGFKNARIFRPGYAIEYDYFPPLQLSNNLETKLIENLFFAGQINGTTGYEEAAAQGLMAGINAHRKINKHKEFILTRDEAYIGVLIDDLITKGTEEPYRLFTSRAEYRILLRQDNADLRLTEKGYKTGLASKERYEKATIKSGSINEVKRFFSTESAGLEELNKLAEYVGTQELRQKVKMKTMLLRPQVSIANIIKFVPKAKDFLEKYSNEILEEAEIQIKYASYILKEKELADKIQKLDKIKIPKTLVYNDISSLSNEGREKLAKVKPATIGQASRISGVSPSDISILLVFIGR